MRARLGAVAVVAGLLLTACTGSADSDGTGSGPVSSGSGATGTGSSTPASGPPPYLPVPDGITLTDPGSELEVGESAWVAWRPRAGEVGVLRLTVRRLEHADIKDLAEWQLSAPARASSLYYVTVTVKNVGSKDLGGRAIPLYVLDDANALVQASAFKTGFKRCPSTPLPDAFKPGEEVSACLAYLVPRHGKLVAASFRPSPTFNPITWVGKVVKPKPTKRPTKRPTE